MITSNKTKKVDVYRNPNADFITALINQTIKRSDLQIFLSSHPESPTAPKIRNALRIHSLVLAAMQLNNLEDE